MDNRKKLWDCSVDPHKKLKMVVKEAVNYNMEGLLLKERENTVKSDYPWSFKNQNSSNFSCKIVHRKSHKPQ